MNKEEISDFLRIQAIKELHKIEIILATLYGNSPDVVSNNNNNELLSTLERQESTMASNNEDSSLGYVRYKQNFL